VSELIKNVTKAYAAKRLPAYKLGVVDKDGNQIVKTKNMSRAQRRSFGPIEKTSMYIRRLMAKNGVASLALALTYLTENKVDEVLEMSVDAPEPVERIPWFDRDDFWKVVMLLEADEDCDDDFIQNVMLLGEEDEKVEEDSPTTVSSGVAGYSMPLGRMLKRKDPTL
jgi:hypothetical protein